MHFKITNQTERIAADHHATAQRNIEVAVGIDVTATVQRCDSKEAEVGVDLEAPEMIAHDDFNAGVEVQDLQDRDLAMDIQQESGINAIPANSSGVQFEQAAASDFENAGVGVDRNLEHHYEAGMIVHVNSADAIHVEVQATDVDVDVEFQADTDIADSNVNTAA